MAKNDYHVIVYQILAYLYMCLKGGAGVEEKNLRHNGRYFDINEKYWRYVIYNMYMQGLITGIGFINIDNEAIPMPADLSACMITPAGIEYLCDNSLMEKAKAFLKDVKEITPFI